jgi:very-short-patch-repair endonuclease
VLEEAVPNATLARLSAIHERLEGDEHALARKRAGSGPRPDLFLRSAALIVEVDEIQHFTSDRLLTLELYPPDAHLAFDPNEYRALIRTWSPVADNYRAAKPAVDFPRPGGRRTQRAYFDGVRDLVAPSFGWTVLRIPVPECSARLAADGLTDCLTEIQA